MHTRVLLRTLAIAVVAIAAVPAPSFAKNPPHPSGLNPPPKDGCQRQDFSPGLGATPEWVYVYKSPAIRTAAGVIRYSHNSLDDAVMQHDWYDFNANMVVDKAYKYLVAGSSSSKTNNYAFEEQDAEEYQRLHFEWEQG